MTGKSINKPRNGPLRKIAAARNGNLQLKIGLCLLVSIIALLLAFSLFGNLSIEINMETRWQVSSSRFPLGSDELGRDLLSCVVYGAGISLFIGLTVVLLASFIGVVLGAISGFAGGIVDVIIMRVVDIIFAFPGILLAIALSAFFTPGIISLVLILTFSSWVSYARLIRAEVLRYKHREFILAARSYNASFFRIIFSHIMPLIFPLVLVQVSLDIAAVILAESSLNFLGLGLDPQVPTLGQLIDIGAGHLFDRPRFIVVPGLALFLVIVSFNFIGEGLRKKFTH